MPRLIPSPVTIQAAGNKPKIIQEFVGIPSTADSAVSVARMVSPSGWLEPGQRPEFREITVVLKGELSVEHAHGSLRVLAGQAVITEPGEWGSLQLARPGRRRVRRDLSARVHRPQFIVMTHRACG